MATATKETEKDASQAKQEDGGTGSKTPGMLAITKKDFVDVVAEKCRGFIERGELQLPKDYNPNNALKAAWLILQNVVDKDKNLALKVCTRDSIANALLDMVVQGLNPIKKQTYFIVYGNRLICQPSYFGRMAIAQMVNHNVGEFAYAVVYEGDKFKYGIEKGKKVIHTHEQDLGNVDKKKIVGAYCVIFDKVGEPMKTEIMTVDEIHQSWRQSPMNPFDDKGNLKESSTHGKFTADMALKTVINKATKILINSSTDNALLLERINRNEDIADVAAAQAEIEENANKGDVLEIENTQTVTDSPKDEHISVEQLFDCPDGGGQVTESQCMECTTLKNCTAHKKDIKQAKPGRMPGF